MTGSGQLRSSPGRALVAAALVACVGLAVGAYVLVPKLRSGPATTNHSPISLPTATDPNAHNSALERLYRSDNQVYAAANKIARSKRSTSPRVVKVPTITGPQSVLVVPGAPQKTTTYRLADLQPLAPAAVKIDSDATVTLAMPIVVGERVRLVVDSRDTPVMQLESAPFSHASLTGAGGELVLRGSANRPLTIRSVVRGTAVSDANAEDGRPFIRTKGGRLELHHSDVADLGYYIGETSGVAWMSGSGNPGRGGSWNSSFSRNHFGAYSSRAIGLKIIDSKFLANRFYGFDPHTDTKRTLVRNSEAIGNGRHGFIFSKGCDHNIIESTVSTRNGGAGFMIDDGNPDLGDTNPSSHNLLRNVVATDNGGPGVVIEGGIGNVVRDATLRNNRVGYWARTEATDSVLQDTTITASLNSAIRIDGASTRTSVSGVAIDGARTGVKLGQSDDTVVTDTTVTVTGTAIELGPTATGLEFSDVSVEGSGPRPVSADSGGLPAGVMVGDWKVVQNRTLVSDLIEFFIHPLAIVTWSVILIPPVLAVAYRRRRSTKSEVFSANRATRLAKSPSEP